MYHLYILCKLADDTIIRCEKNQTINIAVENSFETDSTDPAQKSYDVGQYISARISGPRFAYLNEIPRIPEITLNELLTNAQYYFPSVTGLKPDQYWEYSPIDNNCQYFVFTILTSLNKQSMPGIADFVLQDTKKIIGSLSSAAQKIMQSATDAAAWLDYMIHGAGKRN